MASEAWNWKNKDGSKPGLLYESGNWGDILKLLWLTEILAWKQNRVGFVNYFDPFAGDVHYPLGARTRYRITRGFPEGFALAANPFIKNGWWPSAASLAVGLCTPTGGTVEIWEADDARRGNWEAVEEVRVLDGSDGWELVRARQPDPDAVWMIDPYDVIADWRRQLSAVIEKSRSTTILLYLYNRSGKGEAHFREYRAFRNALDDARGDLPKRVGRVASDAFLPQCHHEMFFLPSEDDCRDGESEQLMERLGRICERVGSALWRVGICDC